MTTNINTEFAFKLGAEFATQINGSADADNWSLLDRDDEVPDGDHCAMRDNYGYEELEQREISEIERAYKAGFNSVFIAK